MADSFLGLLSPANNSGVEGLARLTLDGTTLHVDMAADGATPGQAHPFHIHGFTDGSGTERLAVVSDDANGNGLVETPEGVVASGQPIFDLTASGTNAHGGGTTTDFPAADANGHVQLSQSYQLDPAQAKDAQVLAHLDGRILELHGLSLPAAGHAAGATTYDPTLPVAQAQLFGAQSSADGTNGSHGTSGTGTNAGAGTGTDANASAGTSTTTSTDRGTSGTGAGASGGTGGNTDTGSTGSGTGATGTGTTTHGFDWLHADSSSFLQHANAVLNALAPYELRPDGSGPMAPEPANATGTHATDFAALILPENNSGAFGAAAVHFDSEASTVSVDLWMTGLTPDQAHAAHIHGFSNGQPSLLGNISLDTDGDHFVEDQEGEKVTGPVIMALTQDGSISDAEMTANFASADANGNLQLHQTYQFDSSDPVQKEIFSELEDRLVGREIQLHGLDVTAQQGAGTVNEVNGEEGYKPNLPVASGILLPVTDNPAGQDIASLAQVLETQFANHSGSSDQVFA